MVLIWLKLNNLRQWSKPSREQAQSLELPRVALSFLLHSSLDS
jgi:hypothetical protein